MPRLPRSLHPGAWWLWAIALAVIASRTTNPLLIGLVIAVAILTVVARREDAPWGRSFGLYLRIAMLVVLLRVAFRVVFGGDYGTTVVVALPGVALPEWAGGVRLGGAVTAESILAGAYDGLRLAAIVVCFGAANSLANARRMLRLLPSALYEAGAAIAVAVSLAPQLAEAVVRVRRAQRLRGGARSGWRSGRTVLLPVLEDALDRSISLAAAMDARGYARTGHEPLVRRRGTAVLLVGGLVAACIGLYGTLDPTIPIPFGVPGLVAGLGTAVMATFLAAGRARATRHRPDRWRMAEWGVTATGLTAVALVVAGSAIDAASLHPSLQPLAWPSFAPLPTLGILVAALAAAIAPSPPSPPRPITAGARAAPDGARRAPGAAS